MIVVLKMFSCSLNFFPISLSFFPLSSVSILTFQAGWWHLSLNQIYMLPYGSSPFASLPEADSPHQDSGLSLQLWKCEGGQGTGWSTLCVSFWLTKEVSFQSWNEVCCRVSPWSHCMSLGGPSDISQVQWLCCSISIFLSNLLDSLIGLWKVF